MLLCLFVVLFLFIIFLLTKNNFNRRYEILRPKELFQLPLRDGYFNPSLISTDDDKYIGYVRKSDFNGCSETNDPPWMSHVFFVEFDRRGSLLSFSLVDLPYIVTNSTGTNGIEDARIFRHENSLYGIANTGDPNKMVLWKHEENPVMTFLPSLDDKVPQKNWSPFSKDGEIFFEYSISPRIIFSLGGNVHRGKFYDRTRLSGSACAVLIGDRYLNICHFYSGYGNHRDYYHRFYTFKKDEDFDVIQMGRDFKFPSNSSVEFAAGLDRDGDDVVISFGVNDCHSYLLRMPLKEVKRLLI